MNSAGLTLAEIVFANDIFGLCVRYFRALSSLSSLCRLHDTIFYKIKQKKTIIFAPLRMRNKDNHFTGLHDTIF